MKRAAAAMGGSELPARLPVSLSMPTASSASRPAHSAERPPRVRKALLVALGMSVLLHVAWTFWPVEPAHEQDDTVLQATLTEMPPPPVPHAEPLPALQPPTRRARTAPPKTSVAPPAAMRESDATSQPLDEPSARARAATGAGGASAADATEAVVGDTTVVDQGPPAVALPPRVDLAYKVFLGTHGFMIGDATYRFEHAGDRYRISTVGQARGLAALVVRGTGKVESRGRITSNGLRPYEFAIERGSADRREVAFFDWDAGNVVLHDGGTAQLEPPTFDPLTVLWQPYFSPPGKSSQTFSLATTRRVARYTLTLQGEETIGWPRGEILTERWHRRSDDGSTDAWFWLAPSMHYIPVKMRVTRTSRGTVEVLLDSIRVDDAQAYGLSADMIGAEAASSTEASNAGTTTSSDILFGMPGSGLPPMRAEDLRGQ